MMTKKEWIIWTITVLLIVLAETLPVFTGKFNQRWTFFECIHYLWISLFTEIGWWPLMGG